MEDSRWMEFQRILSALMDAFTALLPEDKPHAIGAMRECLTYMQNVLKKQLCSDGMRTVAAMAESLIQEAYGLSSSTKSNSSTTNELQHFIASPDTTLFSNVAGANLTPTTTMDNNNAGSSASNDASSASNDIIANALYESLLKTTLNSSCDFNNGLGGSSRSSSQAGPSTSFNVAAVNPDHQQQQQQPPPQSLTPSVTPLLQTLLDFHNLQYVNGVATSLKEGSVTNNNNNKGTAEEGQADQTNSYDHCDEQAEKMETDEMSVSSHLNKIIASLHAKAAAASDPTAKNSEQINEQINCGILFKCRFCSFVTKYRANLRRHSKNYHKQQLLLCQFKNAEPGHHPDQQQYQLDDQNPNDSSMRSTISAESGGTGGTDTTVGGNGFVTADDPQQQQLIVPPNILQGKRYVCQKCPDGTRRFKTLWSLREHEMYVHVKVRAFTCPDCNKPFTKAKDVVRHRKTHSEARPFACHCGKTYKIKYHLQRHEAMAHKVVVPPPTTTQDTTVLGEPLPPPAVVSIALPLPIDNDDNDDDDVLHNFVENHESQESELGMESEMMADDDHHLHHQHQHPLHHQHHMNMENRQPAPTDDDVIFLGPAYENCQETRI